LIFALFINHRWAFDRSVINAGMLINY